MNEKRTVYEFLRIRNGKPVGEMVRITDATDLPDAYFKAAEVSEPGDELVINTPSHQSAVH